MGTIEVHSLRSRLRKHQQIRILRTDHFIQLLLGTPILSICVCIFIVLLYAIDYDFEEKIGLLKKLHQSYRGKDGMSYNGKLQV